jgi:hypothetical protein
MGFERRVEPERLDALPPDHPDAIRSRSDLRRLNAWMGTVGTMARLLEGFGGHRRVRLVIELGAGDGTSLLALARRLSPGWSGTTAVLVDRLMVVSPATRHGLAEMGWKVEVVTADVFAGLACIPARDATVVLANLFLHHFHPEALRELLALVAGRALGLVACEPRRSPLALGASRLVGLIGCNAVTRHDAVVSVRAGFRGREISRLWPRGAGWTVEEGQAGPFTHRFAARRPGERG